MDELCKETAARAPRSQLEWEGGSSAHCPTIFFPLLPSKFALLHTNVTARQNCQAANPTSKMLGCCRIPGRSAAQAKIHEAPAILKQVAMNEYSGSTVCSKISFGSVVIPT